MNGIFCRKWLTENIKTCNHALRFPIHEICNFCQAVIFIMLLTISKVPFLSFLVLECSCHLTTSPLSLTSHYIKFPKLMMYLTVISLPPTTTEVSSFINFAFKYCFSAKTVISVDIHGNFSEKKHVWSFNRNQCCYISTLILIRQFQYTHGLFRLFSYNGFTH